MVIDILRLVCLLVYPNVYIDTYTVFTRAFRHGSVPSERVTCGRDLRVNRYMYRTELHRASTLGAIVPHGTARPELGHAHRNLLIYAKQTKWRVELTGGIMRR